MKRVVLAVIVCLFSVPAWAADNSGTLLFSWEEGLQGWKLNNDPGPQAVSVTTGETGATDGKKALAVAMKDDYHLAAKLEDPSVAQKLKNIVKLAVDVTAPEGSAQGFLQVTFAAVADGMPFSGADLQEVPADGKPHTLSFDISAWKIPDQPKYFVLWLVTNTAAKSKPGTIYFDNVRMQTK